VKVPFEPSSKASDIKFQKPDLPFVFFVSETADKAWASDKTSNTISYLSECKSHLEKIEVVALDSIKGIEKLKIQNRDH
ncbi:hypothetical protein, partial [Eggerthella sinensis]|uniref:hypothetical protein n=1 Tax=Eggerthella sinensis TaxID=242230 RepID=UPI001D0676C7